MPGRVARKRRRGLGSRRMWRLPGAGYSRSRHSGRDRVHHSTEVARETVKTIQLQEGMINFTNELSNTPESLKRTTRGSAFSIPRSSRSIPDESQLHQSRGGGRRFTSRKLLPSGYVAVTPGMSNEKAYPLLMQQLSSRLRRSISKLSRAWPVSRFGRRRTRLWHAMAGDGAKIPERGRAVLRARDSRTKGRTDLRESPSS
jgi:hypothetical protein